MVGSFDLHCFEGRELSDKGLRIFGGYTTCVYTLNENSPIFACSNVRHVFDDDVKTVGVECLIPDRADWWCDKIHVVSVVLW